MKFEKPHLKLVHTNKDKEGGSSEKPDTRTLAERYYGTEEDFVDLRNLDLNELPEGPLRNSVKQAAERVIESADSFESNYAQKINLLKKKLQELRELPSEVNNTPSSTADTTIKKQIKILSDFLNKSEKAIELHRQLPDYVKYGFNGEEMRKRLLSSVDSMSNEIVPLL